jgi:hypothetical protein
VLGLGDGLELDLRAKRAMMHAIVVWLLGGRDLTVVVWLLGGRVLTVVVWLLGGRVLKATYQEDQVQDAYLSLPHRCTDIWIGSGMDGYLMTSAWGGARCQQGDGDGYATYALQLQRASVCSPRQPCP